MGSPRACVVAELGNSGPRLGTHEPLHPAARSRRDSSVFPLSSPTKYYVKKPARHCLVTVPALACLLPKTRARSSRPAPTPTPSLLAWTSCTRSRLRVRSPDRKVDVVFPSCAALEEALLQLRASYWRCECGLGDFLAFAKPYINENALESNIVARGRAGPSSDDVWSLDSRGFLTAVVGKETYEILGVVGEPLPWKGHGDKHAIRISLRAARPKAQSTKTWLAYGVKEENVIREWDTKRGPWKIFYHCVGAENMPPNNIRSELKISVQKRDNVYIPHLEDKSMLVRCGRTEEETDAWGESMSSLFEWVGMACLGSPRISVNDRCDPYIAVYTPPEPSSIGSLTCMRWSGLIPPSFVRDIMDQISSINLASPPPFIAVTAQCIGTSPVSYLPPDTSKAPPLRLPREDAEDTWSLVYARDDGERWWVLAESVGQYDKRWG
ncbi:ribonuclease P 40kDa subunit-domain-containing protein [Trametes meyenii]|nr:ribonuclease P 40kDa subunit-domain-containing protein [Trametes meyenii]